MITKVNPFITKKKYFNTKERQRSAINVERFIFALYLPKVNICILSLPSLNQGAIFILRKDIGVGGWSRKC